MGNKWTEAQQMVIDSRNSNLLVSAAAGSGKTAVLIERIIQLILDEKNPVDIDRLLVVTFTKAAASEMKERVGVAIEKALEKNPDNEHLQKQLLLLNKAEITTIDSFCGNIVRSNFHAIDVDPNFKVGDPTEISLIANEVMEDIFDELYKEKDESFLKLVDWYSGNNDDDPLIKIMLMINNFVSSSPYPIKWLDESAEFFNNIDKEDEFYIGEFLKPISTDVKMNLVEYKDFIASCIEELKFYDDFEAYTMYVAEFIDFLDNLLNYINEFLESGKKEKWIELNGYISEKIPFRNAKFSKKKTMDPMGVSIYDEVKNVIKDSIGNASTEIEKLVLDIENIKGEQEYIYPYMRSISDIVMLFRKRFLEKKKSMGVLDFADIEHFALEILTDLDEDGNIISSKIANSYKDKYFEVFTDEYQDSNMVQEIILSHVSREDNPNRFMVGDVKQSIYRFRQAMPEIFMDKYEKYDLYTDKKDSKYRKILLYNNFRSRAEVLEGCNHIFSEIMRKETGELDYTVDERLNPSAKFKDIDVDNAHVGGPIEICLVETKKKNDSEEDIFDESFCEVGGSEKQSITSSDTRNEKQTKITIYDENEDGTEDFEGFRLECINIANMITKMVSSKTSDDAIQDNNSDKSRFMVYDSKKESYRPVEYKDIVILMRATSTKAVILEEVFNEYNIPVYSEAGSGYFSNLEIYTFINLLKIIDNPIQDIPLLSVMRSPMFNFSAVEFSEIRLCNMKGNFYEALIKYYSEGEDDKLRGKVVEFVDKIQKFRDNNLLLTVDELIWYLFRETGYYDFVGKLNHGEQRQNNLMLLFERARQYEKTSYKGLFNFINYVDRMSNRSVDLGEAKTLSEEANVVRIMTIHKSKGLEFPVVILANAEKNFRMKSNNPNLILHQKHGYGPVIYNIEKATKYNSIQNRRINEIYQREQIAEEMRLLYVAMTRAKEKLIISARTKDYEKDLEKWSKVVRDSNGNIHSSKILALKSYLSWIMSTVVNLNDIEDFYDVCGELKKSKGYGKCLWTINSISREKLIEEYKSLSNLNSEDSKFIGDDSIGKGHENENLICMDNSTVDDIDGNSTYTDNLNIHDKSDSSKNKNTSVGDFKYRFESSSNKPSSISVSEVKKILSDEEGKHEYLFSNYNMSLSTPNFIHKGDDKIGYSSAEKGSIFHLVLQLLNFNKFDGLKENEEIRKEIERQINDLVHRKIIDIEEANTVYINSIVNFIQSDIFKDILHASLNNRVYKEKAITYNIPINEIYRNENIDDSERMMLVGIIDLFFESEEGKIILLDYKTDYVNDSNLEEVISRYKVQLEYYKRAIEDISGKEVINKYIYLFSIGKLIEYKK